MLPGATGALLAITTLLTLAWVDVETPSRFRARSGTSTKYVLHPRPFFGYARC